MREPSGGGRRLKGVRLPVAAAFLAVLVSGAPALGQEAPTRIQASAGLGGYVDPRRPVEVKVTVNSDVLFTGHLEGRERDAVIRLPVEVPAGTEKEYRLTLPSPIAGSSVRLRLFAEGSEEVVASLNLSLRLPSEDLLVGVVGADAALLGKAKVFATAAEVATVELDPGDLDRELLPLAYLVVDPTLPATGALESWISQGGRLVIDVGGVDRLGLELPAAQVLEGTEAGISRLGRGAVVTVPSLRSLDAQAWSRILRPAPLLIAPRDAWQTPEPQLVTSASNAGDQRIPTLPWLLAEIVGFAILAGPLNFLVLRRMGRRELAWLTIPALSLVAVAGFWVAGRQRLQTTVLNHSTVVVVEDGTASGRTAVAMAAGNAGRKLLAFPQSWLAYPTQTTNLFDQFGQPVAAPPGTVTGPGQIEFSLDRLGIAAVQAMWSGSAAAPSLSLAPEGTDFNVVATNPTSHEFWAWGIGGRYGVQVAPEPLPAAGSASMQLRALRFDQFGFQAIGDAVISSRQLFNDQFVWERIGSLGYAAGYVAAQYDLFFFGYTDQFTIELEVDGRPTTVRGATIVLVPIDAAVDAEQRAVRAELVGTGRQSWVDWGPGYLNISTTDMTVRFAVPDGRGDPVLAVSNIFGELPKRFEAWNWAAGAFEKVQPNQEIDLGLYRSATGEMLVRALAGGPEEGLPEFFELPMSPYSLTLEWSA
jgi:hypothetical protein